MDVEMVFNELSLEFQAVDIYAARQRMSTFIVTTALATGRFKVKWVLRIEKEFFDTPIAPEYTIKNWLNDNLVNKDEKSRFKRLQTKYPPLLDFKGTEIENRYMFYKFRYNAQHLHMVWE